ncbi:MAG TPA: cupin domain-containing protein [Stellaceae bacterium]|nr:cupin domain-containing protein [Stellaceae bacterium]
MALSVRRIVTGHDASGKAIATSDETLQAVMRRGPYLSGCEIWSTNTMPADNSAEAEAAQRKGFVVRHNYVGNGQGTVIRITQMERGAPAKFMHRTETVDYAILLSGTCDLEFDSGEVKHLKAGDVVVQRGTMHAWVNHGPGPCVFAFVLIDAHPAKSGGQELRTHYPVP